ncbi:hypothetical protein D046_3349B, partial [Vibrio parahaemolyticus V-223/04]
KCFQCS